MAFIVVLPNLRSRVALWHFYVFHVREAFVQLWLGGILLLSHYVFFRNEFPFLRFAFVRPLFQRIVIVAEDNRALDAEITKLFLFALAGFGGHIGLIQNDIARRPSANFAHLAKAWRRLRNQLFPSFSIIPLPVPSYHFHLIDHDSRSQKTIIFLRVWLPYASAPSTFCHTQASQPPEEIPIPAEFEDVRSYFPPSLQGTRRR